MRVKVTLGCLHKMELPKRYSRILAQAEQTDTVTFVECSQCKRPRPVLTRTRSRT